MTKLAEFGWGPFFQQQLTETESTDAVLARVMNVHRSGLQINGPDIDTQVDQIENQDDRATVGDWVLYDPERKRITRRLDRKSLFKRRAPGSDRREQLIAANLDSVFIVSSCNQDFNEARLERYLAIARDAQVMPVIVLSKADLCDDPAHFVKRASTLSPGLMVEAINALDSSQLGCLDAWLGSGQSIALLGSSGVGKSTLSNTLMGSDLISTQAARLEDDKGRHTTTSRSMHHLPSGAWLLDTPGMRELQLTDVKSGLDEVFTEISSLAKHCRYSDCGHQAEPGCAVMQAIEEGNIDQDRLERWHKLCREEAHNTRSLADRRAVGREFGKMYKGAIKNKKLKRQTE